MSSNSILRLALTKINCLRTGPIRSYIYIPKRTFFSYQSSFLSKEKLIAFSKRSVYGKAKNEDTFIKYMLLIIPISTFGLGTWQYHRRKWKLNLIANLKEKTKMDPVDFPQSYESLIELEYRKVKVHGTFDHNREVFIAPRSLLVSGDFSSTGGMLSSGQSGVYVITPMKLLDQDLTILVNRGWVSRKKKNRSTRTNGLTEGPVEFTAVVRTNENKPSFMQKSSGKTNTFLYRDVEQMALHTGSAPIMVDAIETFPDGPIGSQTRVTLRNEHMSYLFTWFSLSFATAFLWYKKFIPKKPLL